MGTVKSFVCEGAGGAFYYNVNKWEREYTRVQNWAGERGPYQQNRGTRGHWTCSPLDLGPEFSFLESNCTPISNAGAYLRD